MLLNDLLQMITNEGTRKAIVDTLVPIVGGSVIFVKQTLADRKRKQQTEIITTAVNDAAEKTVSEIKTWANARFVQKPPHLVTRNRRE